MNKYFRRSVKKTKKKKRFVTESEHQSERIYIYVYIYLYMTYDDAWIMHRNLAVSCFNCESSRRSLIFSCSKIAALKMSHANEKMR